MKKILPTRQSLTPQQKYLLQRIPSGYQMNGYKERPEPAAIKQARKLIEQWDKEERRLRCVSSKRAEALRTKAREAVYFSTPEKALAIVQQCEKLLRDCE